jgi:hypothetical protein
VNVHATDGATKNQTLPALRLLGFSFLILFFELALIRFIPANVRITAYFINLVLIAAFLGMGVGLILQMRKYRIAQLFSPALLLLVAVVSYFSNVIVEAPLPNAEGFYAMYYDLSPQSRNWGMVPAISLLFALITFVFAPLGQAMGEEFEKFPPLRAYSINILGSILGIGVFSIFSLYSTPPLVWFVFGGVVYAVLGLEKRNLLWFAVCYPAVLFMVYALASPGQGKEVWSPYYKINAFEHPRRSHYTINVNGSLHQYLINFSEVSKTSKKVEEDYSAPYRFARGMAEILVLGSGTGNDLVIALQRNAGHIDAVEIDREIVKLGRELNPQKPYDDPRVTVHVDDARAFLKKTRKLYDVIVLGTLDSQTLLSGMSSLRLDNYVYTLESFRAMKEHLKPDGILIMYHMTTNLQIGEKFYRMMAQAFESPPRMKFFQDWRLFNIILVANVADVVKDDEFNVGFDLSPDAEGKDLVLPTDDWPYPYLPEQGIPAHYRNVGLVIAGFAILLTGFALGRKNLKQPDAPMFFLGAGFLLLETKSVTEMSLLFGSTWQVNVLVFASILLLILLANIIILRRPGVRLDVLFSLLFTLVLICFVVPARSLLGLAQEMQWVLGGLMTAGPLFIAGMIFARLFQARAQPAAALGYNLIGAILGGLLEYAAMALGAKALYPIALTMYFLAHFLARKFPRLDAPGR